MLLFGGNAVATKFIRQLHRQKIYALIYVHFFLLYLSLFLSLIEVSIFFTPSEQKSLVLSLLGG